jgi:hypothetical protein
MSLKLMFSKRFALTSLALLSLATVLISLIALLPGEKFSLPFTEDKPVNSLTGIEGNDGPLLVVKIDDTTFAHPQVGLKSADVIYIEQVEGGLTRLAAVFSSQIPSLIGPVRSARISDIELLAQFGKVAFAYSGAQRLLLPVIASANLYDVGANKFGPQFYFNDPVRVAPYAMMLKAPELLTESKSRGITPATSANMGWKFGEPSDNLIAIKSAHVAWPASSYDAVWSDKEDRWLLNHNGKLNLDSSGYVLGPNTFVIQMVSITDSIYKDKVGGVTPFSATVGTGSCYLLRNGGYSPCIWNRPSEDSGTTFTDPSGQELTFEPGQIWFALTAKEPVFALDEMQDATNTSSK